MAIIFDIVRIVDRGANVSYPAGAVLVGFSYSEDAAEQTARLWNDKTNCLGVRYAVERNEETSPARKPWHSDVREDGTIRNPADYGGRQRID